MSIMQHVFIPALESLKTMYLVFKNFEKDPIKITTTSPEQPIILSITHPFREQVANAPKLLAVRFNIETHRMTRRPPSASDFESYGTQGILIRTYTDGLSSLILLRYRLHGQWDFYADFDGTCIPWDRLTDILGDAGETLWWDEPGRDLQLSMSAWKALREWLEKSEGMMDRIQSYT
jgi:hypothetical protein